MHAPSNHLLIDKSTQLEYPGPLSPMGPLRHLYLAMLAVLDIPAIRAFWKAHPLVKDGRKWPEADLYRSLWANQELVSVHYVAAGWNDFERYVHRHNLRVEGMLTQKIRQLQQSGVWKAEEVLNWIKDFLPRLYQDPDPRLTLVHVLLQWIMHAFPGSWGIVGKNVWKDDWEEAITVWAPSKEFEFPFYFCQDINAIPFNQDLPLYFGMPAYEEVRLFADCRPPEMVLWDDPWRIQGDSFFVGPRSIGKIRPFSNWANEQGLDFQGHRIPDKPIVQMNEDYVCPQRGRIVLFRNCIYDAPLYMVHYRFRSGSALGDFAKPEHYLDKILSWMLQDFEEEWKPLTIMHRQLLRAAEERIKIEYRRSANSMYLNGKTFLVGTQARILHKILQRHSQGQASFDYRAFKADPELFQSHKRTNFEVHFKRIKDKLSEEVPSLYLERPKAGEFIFRADCPLEFQETD